MATQQQTDQQQLQQQQQQRQQQQRGAAEAQRPMRGIDVGINNYPDTGRSSSKSRYHGLQDDEEDEDEEDSDEEEEYQGTYYDGMTPDVAKMAVAPEQRQPDGEARQADSRDELLAANSALTKRAECAERSVEDLQGRIAQLEQQLVAQQRLREEALAELASKHNKEALEQAQTIARLVKMHEQLTMKAEREDAVRAAREEAWAKMETDLAATLATLREQLVASTSSHEQALREERERAQAAQARVSQLEQQVQELSRVQAAPPTAASRRAPTDADYSRLWQACETSDLATVTAVLNEVSVDVNRGNPNNDLGTALHLAAEKGNSSIVQALLDAGAAVDAVDQGTWTALHHAAFNGQVTVVRTLLAAGADVHAVDCGQRTPLHTAAWKGHESVIQTLLDAGANVNAVDNSQNTTLHEAASNGHALLVSYLLDAGANVNAVNKSQRTPLHHAASNGHAFTVELLLGNGANPVAKNKDGKTPLDLCTTSHLKVSAVLRAKMAASM